MCVGFTTRSYQHGILKSVSAMAWRQNISFHVRPTEETLALRRDMRASGESLAWGFRPGWLGQWDRFRLHAPAETVATVPMFGATFRRRRCLVFADGFYESLHVGGARQQRYFFFQRPDKLPFAFAAIWTTYDGPSPPHGLPYDNFAIITCASNRVVGTVHSRMPVILGEGFHEAWLDPEYHDAKTLHLMLRPWSDRLLEGWEVTPDLLRKESYDATACDPIGPRITARQPLNLA